MKPYRELPSDEFSRMFVGDRDSRGDVKSVLRFLWLLGAFCLLARADAAYRFNIWTADDGLPQNVITGITQTSDGYLWIATFNGLARCDGVRFAIFDKGNSPAISSNRLTSLYAGRNSDLWLGTG